MEVIQQLTTSDTIRELTQPEVELGVRIFTINMGYKPGESVLVVTDTAKLEQEAAVWFESAKQLENVGAVRCLVIDKLDTNGQEPPAEVIAAGGQADIVMLHTTRSLTHTSVSKAASAAGGRVASLPGVDYEILMRTVTQNYEPVQKLGEQLKKVVEQGDWITVTSQYGTSLTAQIRQNHVENDCGFVTAGEITNLPAGEVFFAPIEGTAQGSWVVNGSIASAQLDEPVEITIKDGMAVAIRGGAAARELEKILVSVGPLAFNVAEIGIGTNQSAAGTGPLIEAEKAYGTAHLALGNNSVIGGQVNVPIHIDGVTLDPTITVDKTVIMKDNTFIL